LQQFKYSGHGEAMFLERGKLIRKLVRRWDVRKYKGDGEHLPMLKFSITTKT
jgi:hypothetical protein